MEVSEPLALFIAHVCYIRANDSNDVITDTPLELCDGFSSRPISLGLDPTAQNQFIHNKYYGSEHQQDWTFICFKLKSCPAIILSNIVTLDIESMTLITSRNHLVLTLKCRKYLLIVTTV